MTTENITSHLRLHAGLDNDPDRKVPMIADCSWLANGYASQVTAATDDVIHTLGRLNKQINGDVPSQSVTRVAMIHRQIVFAVEEIRRLLRVAADQLTEENAKSEFIRQEWRISVAWYAVICGDIDSLERYIADEDIAR